MKYGLIALILCVFISCKKSELVEEQTPFEIQNTPQKWELVAITSSWTGEVTTGDDLDWKEFYILNPDSTFLKSRNTDGNITESTGTFEIFTSFEGQYLELLFEKSTELRASCYKGKEFLSYRLETLANDSWRHCDGPIMEYRFVKE